MAEVHLPNDKYREGWDRIFGSKRIKSPTLALLDNSSPDSEIAYIGYGESDMDEALDLIAKWANGREYSLFALPSKPASLTQQRWVIYADTKKAREKGWSVEEVKRVASGIKRSCHA